jgi:hypothetical protein
MKHDRPGSTSRRDALQRGLGAVAGVAIVWATGSRPSAAAGKLTKAAVQYVDAGTVPDKDCDDCVQFVPGKTAAAPGTCRIVEGQINPHGHCIAFTPKPKR